MEVKPGYYSNPAFCQQSEFYSNKRPLSPHRSIRQSPVGAQTSHVVFDSSLSEHHQDLREERADNIEEQEFYEEVIVDDKGFIKGKQFVVVAQNHEGQKYIQVPQEERRGRRYGAPQPTHHNPQKMSPSNDQRTRYEYIPMQEQDRTIACSTPRSPPKKIQEEQVEVFPGVVHRYAVIEAEEETQLTGNSGRYALVPVSELNQMVTNKNKHRYEYIPNTSSPANVHLPQQSRQSTPPRAGGRYEYIPQVSPQKQDGVRVEYLNSPRPGTNPAATRRLYELLSTPKKAKDVCQGQTPPKMMTPQNLLLPPVSPIVKDPFQTPRSSPQKAVRPQPNPKVQQKLNYAIASKQIIQEKRHTAIVPPMCSSPIQSVYSETTVSQKSESWMNLSAIKSNSTGAALVVAALIMFLCGTLTSGLSFYMISEKGRWYYLDFSVVAGFACVVMGLLGCRSRNVYWLPNRNYLSGYLVLSLFSILTCAGLSILLIHKPRSGTPLADMTSGAICGLSVMTLLLAAIGLISSYCCKYPPPDNRVQHCSPSLTV